MIRAWCTSTNPGSSFEVCFGALYPGSELRRKAPQLPLCAQWLLPHGNNEQGDPRYTKSLNMHIFFCQAVDGVLTVSVNV